MMRKVQKCDVPFVSLWSSLWIAHSRLPFYSGFVANFENITRLTPDKEQRCSRKNKEITLKYNILSDCYSRPSYSEWSM